MKGMRISEERLSELPPAMTARALGKPAPKSRAKPRDGADTAPPPLAPAKAVPSGKGAMQALGRLPKGVMNKTEQAYADHLEQLKRSGEVVWFKFEPMKLSLAKATTYTADFLVQLATGYLELHEVKGRWEDDARVKIKVAAELYPIFKFVAIQKGKKGEEPWKIEEF